ncbi:MAG: HlyD family efflux transporter periplasmic adaptor subunit [Clostridium sp.]|nr:HlyD family efflux transporter periplasmic adaptor subunit [Clostridium sp.]
MKKLTAKKKMMAGVILLAVILILIFVFRAGKKSPKRSTEETVLSVEVTRGTIESGVSGTGTLAYGETASISVPADLQLEEVLVSAGEEVAAGTLLATVEPASLAACLSEVDEAIGEVDDTISTEKDKSESTKITANVAGRVKEIYAKENDPVTEVMEENGALALLSTDGYMAVDLTNAKGVAVGDTVKVTDGTTSAEGTVSSVEGETAVILFSDSSFAVGAGLSVTDSEEAVIGEAEAYVHAPLKVVGTNGTVNAVKVSVDSSVSASSTLFTLKETSQTVEYQQAVQERKELEELLTMLIAIQRNGGITALQDGVITAVNAEGSAGENSSVSNGSTLAAGKEDEKVDTKSDTASENGEVQDTLDLASVRTMVSSADTVSDLTQEKNLTSTGGFAAMSSSSIASSESKEAETLRVSEKPALEAPAGLTGGEGVINGTTTDMEYAEKADASDWKACTDKTTVVTAGTWYVRYRETDENAASPAVQVEVRDKTADTANGAGNNQNTESDGSGKTPEDSGSQGNTGSQKDGDNTGENTNPDGSGTKEQGSTAGKNNSGTTKGSTVTAGSGSSASAASSSESSSGVETTELFAMADSETMTVTMTVDELDILSMEAGLEAVVSVDAVEDKTFTGTITNVSRQTSGNGGTAQYSVEVTFEKTEEMLEGMNASVEVILEKAENVLVVPISAVTDRGRSSVVYKGNDNGVLSDETEIETGLSDETYAEVTSGLSEGDTIYYQMAGSEDSGNGQMGGFGGFGGEDMMNGGMPGGDFNGERPDRSDMPGGNGGRGGDGGRNGRQE